MENIFEEGEIKRIVMQMPAEKAPGPDGFIGLFYKKCWPIIRTDLIQALQAFHSLKTRKIELINQANIVLLPKKAGAALLSEFRPISLINSVAKIVTKILADRLAPRLMTWSQEAKTPSSKKGAYMTISKASLKPYTSRSVQPCSLSGTSLKHLTL